MQTQQSALAVLQINIHVVQVKGVVKSVLLAVRMVLCAAFVDVVLELFLVVVRDDLKVLY